MSDFTSGEQPTHEHSINNDHDAFQLSSNEVSKIECRVFRPHATRLNFPVEIKANVVFKATGSTDRWYDIMHILAYQFYFDSILSENVRIVPFG